MPTFGAWEQTVLEHCFEHVEAISLHLYVNDYAADPGALLATGVLMDRFIEQVVAIADGVAARRHSAKRIMLSFDEWNVWYRTRRRQQDRTRPGWPVAPPVLEEIYSLQDALAFGGMCISLLNHADRVKIACLAQLVNVIAPIMTATGGAAWRQTIFHPFAQFSRFGRGTVLRAEIDAPEYSARYYDPRGAADVWFPLAAPYLSLAAVHDAAAGTLTLFTLNRHLTEAMPLEVSLSGFAPLQVETATQLRHHDLHATNTADHPDRVAPATLEGVRGLHDRVLATLAPASWSMIRLRANPAQGSKAGPKSIKSG
jgi:alpha-N-arabinofuranosidase